MNPSIAVIGAGIAGLSCAKKLIELGYQVKVFEKSKGLSGRCSTRKLEDTRFDHGAQFFTAKSDSFKQFLQLGLSKNEVAQWQPKMYSEQQSSSWYVGVPGMSSLGNLFDINSSVQLHSEVKQLTFDRQTWTLSYRVGEEDIHESFDELILAIPAQQALSLLQELTFTNPDKGSDLNQIVHFLSQIQMYPCWTLMVKSDQQFFHQWPYDAYQCPESQMETEAIAWLARNSSKPDRKNSKSTDQWVIQATPNWSSSHLEDSGEVVSPLLITDLENLFGIKVSSSIIHSIPHRWRYARVKPYSSDQPFIFNSSLSLGICGDFFTKSRVEAAYLSGYELAHRYQR